MRLHIGKLVDLHYAILFSCEIDSDSVFWKTMIWSFGYIVYFSMSIKSAFFDCKVNSHSQFMLRHYLNSKDTTTEKHFRRTDVCLYTFILNFLSSAAVKVSALPMTGTMLTR